MLVIVNTMTILSSCYFKSDCLVLPQSVYCPTKKKSDYDSYSKTNVGLQQKNDDIKSCGGVVDKYGSIFTPFRKANPADDGFLAIKNFGICMKSKGYMYID